ncbi:Lead, cadmium, zinc and mercury transporting ATPase [Vibrio jasicida]|uniref:Lead, cadmium, zinc and mercury transporting ATPase n=1 Tax=Vibrio jasicida TaxID=766224 RepID=A0AAU9QXL7_9VIBR|nr:Lead, cadmium, zinc and mercury transporting ATPase [Vibrio jasicida]CAH1603851.1 Lead, cadmium, zinc and mercury transporting ATPase [Vibrio jasicida]
MILTFISTNSACYRRGEGFHSLFSILYSLFSILYSLFSILTTLAFCFLLLTSYFLLLTSYFLLPVLVPLHIELLGFGLSLAYLKPITNMQLFMCNNACTYASLSKRGGEV